MSGPWEDYAPSGGDGPWMDYKRAGAPPPVADIDVSALGDDPKVAKAAIDKLPEPMRPIARDKWADAVVAKERAGGGAMQTAGDYLQRFGRSIPGVGPWIDEASAGLQSMFGGDYEMAHAYERALKRAIDKTPTPKLGTLPVIGDVTAGGLTEAAGVVGGSLAMPMLRVAGGVGAVPTAVNVGANAALYGGADAAGNAEPDRRVSEGIKGAVVGGAIGAPLGAAVGRFAGRAAPAASDALARDAAAVGVDLPTAAAGDGMTGWATRQVAGGAANVPVLGAPLVNAANRATSQMDDAAARIADRYAPSPAAGVPAGATPATAGEAVSDALSDWIGSGSRRTLDRLYSAVESKVPLNATEPLGRTRFAVQTLLGEDAAAASNVNEPAIRMVADAISRPGGMTYRGLQQLRTNVGAMIDDSLLPAAGTTRPGLKRLHASLTQDLEALVAKHGGPDAMRAWEFANDVARNVAGRREELTRIIGVSGNNAPESIVERLVGMAGSGPSANISRLEAARKAAGARAWDDLAAAAIQRLGRNQADDFSPAIFLRKYSALTDRGRQILFDSTGKGNLRAELDSLARVAQKFQSLEKFGNPSGTGRATAVSGSIAALATGAISLPGLIATAIPAAVAVRMMAKPLRVRQISQASQLIYDAVTSPNGSELFHRGLLGLARAVADETKEDPAAVQQRLERSLRGR